VFLGSGCRSVGRSVRRSVCTQVASPKLLNGFRCTDMGGGGLLNFHTNLILIHIGPITPTLHKAQKELSAFHGPLPRPGRLRARIVNDFSLPTAVNSNFKITYISMTADFTANTRN